MRKNKSSSRRDFMKGALAAGAALALTKIARSSDANSPPIDFETPLVTQRIPQPDNIMCSWAGFSPVNNQVAFASGMFDNMKLYVSRSEQPEVFDILWESNADFAAAGPCAWSPDGKEIAFFVQTADKKSSPTTAKYSLCIVDVISKEVREPIVISETINGESKQYLNISRQKGMAWWNESNVCVPAKAKGGLLKFDTHTGKQEALLPAQDASIYNLALTASKELRFIKVKSAETAGSQHILCGITQDGAIREYFNINEQFSGMVNAHLSDEGEYLFVEKYDTPSASKPLFKPMTNIIYKIDAQSVIGQIPRVVNNKKDTYSYMPLTVRNNNELILIEVADLPADGNASAKNMTTKIVKKIIA